jgi:hypothetical protein
MNPDTTDPDTTDPDTTDPDSPVTTAEIAELLRQLRARSRPSATVPTRDTTAERAAFLARKADLFTRIAAQHPDLIPTPTPTPTPTDGGVA